MCRVRHVWEVGCVASSGGQSEIRLEKEIGVRENMALNVGSNTWILI